MALFFALYDPNGALDDFCPATRTLLRGLLPPLFIDG
jgi:hypothetical protein